MEILTKLDDDWGVAGVALWLWKPHGKTSMGKAPGFELFEFHVGCNVSDAWLGVDLGAGNTVNNVKCVRIFQAESGWNWDVADVW